MPMPYTVQVQAAVDAIENAGFLPTYIVDDVGAETLNTVATALAEAWKLLDPGRRGHILTEFINMAPVAVGERIRVARL